jgi:hypothetical protein
MSDPAQSKQAVLDFLLRCVEYADTSLQRKQARLSESTAETEKEVILAEIAKWEAYREYTAHAITEVEDGELDHWFKPDQDE